MKARAGSIAITWTNAAAAVLVFAAAAILGRTAARAANQTPAPSSAPSTAAPAAHASPFVPPEPLAYDDHDGWTSIFDGRTLAGWDGNPAVWRVVDGAITAESTPEHRVGSTHLIWTGGELADFELKIEVKLDGDIHSGIAYRSAIDLTRGTGRAGRAGRGATATAAARSAPALQIPADPRWTLYGPGLDFDADPTYAGNVEDRGTERRELAWRGDVVRAEAGKKPRIIGSLGDPDALKAFIRVGDWNQLHIIARGHEIIHIINGHVMTILIDEDPQYFRPSGAIGLQIEQFGSGRVNFRNIWIKKLKTEN